MSRTKEFFTQVKARSKRVGTRAENTFGLSAKRTSPFKLTGGGEGQFSWLLAAEVFTSVAVMVVMLDTPCFAVECNPTGYKLHSSISPSLPLPYVTVCRQVSTALYCVGKHVRYSVLENTFLPIRQDTWLSSRHMKSYRIKIGQITANNRLKLTSVVSVHTNSGHNYIGVPSFRLHWLSLCGPRAMWGHSRCTAVCSGPNMPGQERHTKIS